MKKIMLTEPGKFELMKEALPEPGRGEVRLRVQAAGVCGTDLEVYKGNFPDGWDVVFPFQLGHELSGIVDAVGPGVPESFKPGSRVVPDGRITCGYCSFCRRGQFNACENMGYNAGGFREYSVYHFKSLVHIPDNVSFKQAAMAEPISCTIYGNDKLDVKIGDFAVVIGDGAIGLLHAQLLKSRGAEVALVGLLENRLKAAGQIKIEHVIDGNQNDPVAEIGKLTSGYGANQVVVAAGVEEALKQSLQMSGRYGQVLYFAANMKEECSMPMDLIHYKELKLIGSFDSTTAHFEQALRAIATGAIDVDFLITNTFDLKDTEKAFKSAIEGNCIKTMIINEE